MANDNENPMSYRVIALDLDGTLLDNQKRILPQSLEALALARAAGIRWWWSPAATTSLSIRSTRRCR